MIKSLENMAYEIMRPTRICLVYKNSFREKMILCKITQSVKCYWNLMLINRSSDLLDTAQRS